MDLERAVRFQRSDEALSRRVGVDVLVTLPTEHDVHELSGGASAVWEALRTPSDLAELVAGLAAKHGVDPDEIAADVTACVETLQELGVVREVHELDG